MEIVAISAAVSIVSILAIVAWVWVRLEQHNIQYGSHKEIKELRDELSRQAQIVNRLDAEGLEHVKLRADEIAGQLRDIKLGQVLKG